MMEKNLFWPDNPDYLLSICGNEVHKTQGFINIFCVFVWDDGQRLRSRWYKFTVFRICLLWGCIRPV